MRRYSLNAVPLSKGRPGSVGRCGISSSYSEMGGLPLPLTAGGMFCYGPPQAVSACGAVTRGMRGMDGLQAPS